MRGSQGFVVVLLVGCANGSAVEAGSTADAASGGGVSSGDGGTRGDGGDSSSPSSAQGSPTSEESSSASADGGGSSSSDGGASSVGSGGASSVATVSVCNPLVSIVIGTLLLDERLAEPLWHKTVAYLGLGLALVGAVVISLATEGAKERGSHGAPEPSPATV